MFHATIFDGTILSAVGEETLSVNTGRLFGLLSSCFIIAWAKVDEM